MSDLRKNLIRLAHANPEMRQHVLPLLKEAAAEKKARMVSIKATSVEEAILEIFSDVFADNIQDVDSITPQRVVLSMEDSWGGPGDEPPMWKMVINFHRNYMAAMDWAGRKTYKKININVWKADLSQLARAFHQLKGSVPETGGDHPDSPSLQDTAPAEYFTERRAFGDQSWGDSDSSAPETIWGSAQQMYKVIPGVAWYSTAGHGGIGVDPSAARKYLSDAARKNGDYDMGKYWYEEDELCLIPLYENPEWAAILKRKMGGGDISKYTTPERMKRMFPRYWRMVEKTL